MIELFERRKKKKKKKVERCRGERRERKETKTKEGRKLSKLFFFLFFLSLLPYLVLRQADGLELLVVDGLGLEVRGGRADERGLLLELLLVGGKRKR